MKIERNDLEAPLLALGWGQADLARKLGVTKNQVSKWATGKAEVPKYARAYLDLALALRRIAVLIERKAAA